MLRRPPRSTRTDTLFPYTTLFRSGQQGLQIEVSLRTDEAFQLLARRPIDTAVAAPQENMLEHGIDRLPARTKIVGNPPRQRPAIRLRHTAEPEMPQNLRAMPAGGAPGKIIVVHGFGIRSEEHTSELQSLMR